MNPDPEEELIRVETYAHSEDAHEVRSFLQSHGIAGVVVVEKTNPTPSGAQKSGRPGYVFDLCVPTADSARAIHLMQKEWNMPEVRSGLFHEDASA